MKKVILVIFLFICWCSTVCAKSIENPIYLVKILLGYSDIEQLNEICKQYEFWEVGTENEFLIFSNDNGDIIRIRPASSNDSSSLSSDTIVVIEVNDKKVNINDTMLHMGFRKEGNVYVNGSIVSRKYTVCSICKDKKLTLTFSKVSPKQ